MAFNPEILYRYFPIGGKFPPALTAGLSVFLILIFLLNFVFNINDSIVLSPSDLFEFNLNKLSLYPLGHLSVIHLLFNVLSLVTPLSQFERKNGTVYTGVILNLFAVFTGIPYCLAGTLLGSKTKVIGSSGWVFSFFGYFAYKESLLKPTFQIIPTFVIPTLYTPFIPLILSAVLIPGSSFLGHLLGLLIGYSLGFGYLSKLAPPSKIIEWIESKLEKLINLIPSQFVYYREVDAKYIRNQDEYVSVFASNTLPTTSTTAGSTTDTIPFSGHGQVLGV